MSIDHLSHRAVLLTALLLVGAGAAAGDDKLVPVKTPPAGEKRTAENFGVAVQPPFTEHTVVVGEGKAELEGVWLLVAYAEVAPGKFKTFPQLLKIGATEKGPEFHLLDVRLPAVTEQELLEASMRTLTKWVPTPELLATLAATWRQLKPATEKTLNEYLFAKIEYTLAHPDAYAQSFPQRDGGLESVLAGSAWSLKVVETFRARDLPAEARVAQLVQRTTIYGAKQVGAEKISGNLSLGFIAAGAATPLPFSFQGDFVLHRLSPP